MAFIYTRAQYKQRVNSGIKNKIGMLVDANETLNQSVRDVISDYDLRATIRSVPLTPKLFSGIYDYQLPVDLKGNKLIDIPPQILRADGSLVMNSPEVFDLAKAMETGIVTVDEMNGVKILRISSAVDSIGMTLSELDDLTSAGSWIAFGDAENLRSDIDDYISGAGAIAYDINSSGGTTAGIQTTALSAFDITNYMGGAGAVFIRAYVNDPTGLTNFKLRIGNGPSNYYEQTITAQSDGTAFVAGWNTLRFDLNNLTTVGSVSNINMIYCAIFMTKTSGKINELGYRFDLLSIGRGKIYNVKYYSKYGWVSSAGAYKENSTDDSDILVADTDEYNLFVEKGIANAAREVDEYEIAKDREAGFLNKIGIYVQNNPSLAKIVTDRYEDFGSGNGIVRIW